MIIHNGGPQQSLDGIVLFPFDDHSIPLQTGLDLQLVPHRTSCNRTRIVVPTGEPGDPDHRAVVYYGTVRRVGNELWMWYLGQDEEDGWFERVCFARSKDGYHWEKPELGLVPYKGSKCNNLVDLNQASHHVQACVVFHDEEDPDPTRRFKMAFQCRQYRSQFAAAYSADGLTWREAEGNPVGAHLEMAGGTRHNGMYVLSGQGGNHPPPNRQMVNHISYDFENWSEAFCIGLRRGDRQTRLWGASAGPQVHLGAALWDRGNVVIGLYGMWNGHRTNDRRLTQMDLGLAVSNDALHFREPLPEFPFVSAAEDGWYELPNGDPSVTKYPALIQGQGYENIGDETLFWYAPWPEQVSDGVRVARWQRDRLGYFQGYLKNGLREDMSCHFVSAPVDLEARAARVTVNAEGLGQHSQVRVEILDEQLRTLPGYGCAECCALADSGLRQPVCWGGSESVRSATGRIRLRVHIEGVRPEDARVYAVYVESTES